MLLSHRGSGGGRRRVAAALVLALGIALVGAVAPAASASSGARHDYIVVLKSSANGRSAAVAADHASRYGAQVRFVYSHALNGYAASIPDANLAALRTDASVDFVEADGTVSIDTTQNNPPSWGLDRIDQVNLPLSNSYTYTNTGAGVRAYIIDTGIFTAHNNFGGRATSGFDAIDGGTADDCHGHGTHVAGTTGGSTYGVAKGVSLIAVRVLDCGGSGTYAQVIAGVDWVTGDHDPGEPAVANMSLGGSANNALDTAIRNSITDGTAYSIAAGNGDAFGNPLNACTVSPARVKEAMTNGASDITDKAATFSNFGRCIDWYAPGVNITSSWIGSPNASNTISGTSMATPHTTGVAALYLQTHPAVTPAQLRTALFALTTKNKITGAGNTRNNDLLFTNF